MTATKGVTALKDKAFWCFKDDKLTSTIQKSGV